MNKASQGISLIEYLLIGCLVAVVCVASCLAFGNDFQKLLSNVLARMQGNIGASTSAVTASPTSALPGSQQLAAAAGGSGAGNSTYTGPTIDGNSILPPPAAGQERFCMEGGFCLNVPRASSGGNVEAVGGNGTTNYTQAFAQVLDQIVQQLEQSENADPELRRLVTDLANKGHNIADSQYQAEQELKCGGVGINAFCGSVSMTAGSNELSARQDLFFMTKGELDAYLAAHPGALPSAMRTVIEAGADNIDEITAVVLDNLSYSRSSSTDNPVTPPTVTAAEKLTETNANGICGSGGKASECTRQVYNKEATTATVAAGTATPKVENGMVYNGSEGGYMEATYVKYRYANKNRMTSDGGGGGDGGTGAGAGGDGSGGDGGGGDGGGE